MNSGKTYNIQNPKALLFSLCFVLMFSVMNGTMFNIAIPDIAESFNLLPSQVSWVMTGYIMVFAIGALIYGKLTDTIALKTLITFGLCVFSIGSLVGFIAPNYTTVLIARLIQAVGGAMIPAIAFIAPIRYFPNERGKVLGIISSVMAFASGIGPIMGGVIGGFLNWQYLFLTSSLIIITLPLLRANLPQEETNFVKLDYLGAGLVAGFIVSLLIGITLSYPVSFLFSVIFLILVVIRMKMAKNPFIPPKLFMNQSYVITIMVSFLAISCLFGLMFSVPIMLREVYELTTLQIGLTMFPGAMSAALIGRKGGQLVDQKGSRTVLLWSMLLLMTGFFIVSTTVGLDPIWMSLSLIFPMMCFPLVQSSGADTLASILKDRETGVGMGVFNLLIFVSGAISGAVVGKTLDVFRPQVPVNPIGILGDGAVFSNIFLVFMGLIFIGFLIFKTLFKTYVIKAES